MLFRSRHVRLRNPIKSTLAHDAVAAVVLHKHHLIIRVGVGLIQFVYGSHSRLAADLTLDKNLFPLPFSRAFSCVCVSRVYERAYLAILCASADDNVKPTKSNISYDNKISKMQQM